MDCGPGLVGLNQVYVPNCPTPSVRILRFVNILMYFLKRLAAVLLLCGHDLIVDHCAAIVNMARQWCALQ